MKFCTRCKTEQEDTAFNWRNKEKGTRNPYCKPCQSAYTKEHYRKNPEPYRQRARISNKEILLEIRVWLYKYLCTHPCTDCGESDPIVLEFDHTRDKKYTIAHFRGRVVSLQTVIDEVAKCEIRCANCHKRKTAKQFNWYADMRP